MKKNILKNKKGKKKELVYEWRRVAYFFQFFDVETSTEHLWEMLKLALTSEDDSGDVNKRSDMIFFYEYTKELFENIYILLQEKKKTTSKKSS
jgi:hypothetical protein